MIQKEWEFMVAQVDIKLKAGRFSEAFGTELYPGITPQVHAVPKLELDMSCLMVDHSRREFRPNSMIACVELPSSNIIPHTTELTSSSNLMLLPCNISCPSTHSFRLSRS